MTPPRLAEPYQRHPVREAYDAIVIGSGIGGLAAAALLARHGQRRVLVLERHYAIGGFTHVFRRPGYEWDVGVHYVGEVQPGGLLRPQTPVRGLFLTGADVATCGVGGALIGGALCASAILRRNLIDAARRTHGERAAA